MRIIGSIGKVSEVALSTSSATLVDVDDNRMYVIIHNASGQTLYIHLGDAAATTSNFSVVIADGDRYEVPGLYRGKVTGVLGASTGNAYVTELS